MEAAQSENELRKRAIAQVHAFLDLLSAKDMANWSELWADDAVQDMPYAPTGFPNRVEGKAMLVRHYSSLPASTGRMAFVARVVHPLVDPNTVLVEYRGEIEIVATGKSYDNRYAGLFSFDADGKLKLFREYFDPTILIEAWVGALVSGFNLRDTRGS